MLVRAPSNPKQNEKEIRGREKGRKDSERGGGREGQIMRYFEKS